MIFIIFSLFALTSAANECPDGWIFNHDLAECFYVSEILYSFDESIKICDSIGGSTVTVRNSLDNSAFIAMFNTSVLQPWIGTRRNTTSNTFYNIDQSYFTPSLWAVNEPSVNGDCVTFRGVQSTGLQITQCYSLQPAFCKQVPALCNSGTFGGAYTMSGVVTSPGYPTQYYNNLKCSYLINSPNNTYITLNFDPYLVEAWNDNVKIYEGNQSVYQNSIGTVLSYMTSFESQANQVLITFETNYRITQRGWNLSWKAKTIQPTIYLSGMSGNFSSPNYPADYNKFDEQVYIISAPYGTQINLTIDDFVTEKNHDYLDIYTELMSMKNETYAARLSGNSIAPYNFISNDYFLGFRFVSDGSLNYRGFHAYYNVF
ncbi:unnamed protein product [Caenorhabditis angaria]|uniref:CUB domain-containing protein n=1 Tax=Caenorhabditis angaria TaxID=860376 RepID=A0A9P1IYG2_9PELO|nr:unnamed protein product [Caenorhabditis angaria]